MLSLAAHKAMKHASVYQPHQGQREKARRVRALRAGAVQNSTVSDRARLNAMGLIHPSQAQLVRVPRKP